MRNTSFFLVVALIAIFGFGAQAQVAGNDSYTIQRLIVFNQDGDVLLEKHKNGWMTPALRHNSKSATNTALKELAAEFGLKISSPKLAGNFMFIAEYKSQSSFRQHYTARQVGGELTLPHGKLDAKWTASHEVAGLMSSPDAKLIYAVRDMTIQVLSYPEIIWGGTFSLWKENDLTVYRTVEDFHPIGLVRRD